jgi:riboflavin-specific deaminase-like protein
MKMEFKNKKLKPPFVLSNFAMTADGKIAFANGRFEPFSSRRDRAHMLELRATADAVMCGARTVEAAGLTLGTGGAKYRRQRLRHGLAENHLRIVVSGSGSVSLDADIFKHRFSPIIVLTTARISPAKLCKLAGLADEVKICGKTEINFPATLRWLREKWNVKRLLCEGGGELHAALVQAGLLDELHLTLCPKIFGGRMAPAIADGQGVENLAGAARFRLHATRLVKNEFFTVFRAVKQKRRLVVHRAS